MIVQINTGKKPAGAVRYNEEKVVNGQARSIGILNYQLDNTDGLSVRKKIDGLELYTKLNQNVSSPTLHISMAFHPSENFTDEQLKTMGEEYMQKMGYGQQPMLIYRHEDTHHPHIHIVSVSIDDSGKKISDSNAKRRSNGIRKEMEINYQLIKAEEQGKQQLLTTKLPEQMLEYGEAETKKAIGTIVRTAFTDYSFSSTDTFAQFLATYNIQLNQVKGATKDGKQYQGISFQLTNGEAAISPPIKASQYSFAPTQQRLDNRFKHGKKRMEQAKPQVLQHLQNALATYQKISESDFKNVLRSTGIQVLDTGQKFIYVDHARRAVYDESELNARLSRRHLQRAFVETSQLKEAPRLPTKKEIDPVIKSVDANGETPPLSEKSLLNLRKQVGRHYQQYRRDSGQFFESQTIERFPYQQLVDKLQQEDVPRQHAQTAVRLFETYKQSQLPEIKSKEASYFLQTAGMYLKLATQMPITAQSRLSFLESVNLKAEQHPDGYLQLVHRHHAALGLALTVDQRQTLLNGGPRPIAFPATLSKADRDVFLAAASGQPPQSSTFYEVNGSLLKNSLPPTLYDSISTQLNKNYLQQVISHYQPGKRRLADQLLDRGVILTNSEQGYRAGYYHTHPGSFMQLPPVYQHQLEAEGLPIDYKQTVQKLSTPTGRLLILAAQGNDTGNQPLLERIKRQLPQTVEHQAQSNTTLIERLRATLLSAPVPVTGQPIQRRGEGAGFSREDSATKILQDALWKAYFTFRGRNGYFYESALLQKPAEFPTTQLVQVLSSPPYSVSPLEAGQLVERFQQQRLNRLDAIIQRDEAHFTLTSQGFLNLVNQAPLTGPDRQKALRAFYLDVYSDADGRLEIVHHQHKSFRRPITQPEKDQLLGGAPAGQVQSILLPSNEFPRFERVLYEQLVLGQKLTKSDADKERPSFRNVMGERVKVLLSGKQWDRAAQLLNENTANSLLKESPLRVEAKLDWLYQRGVVIAHTKEGYKIGHYLTDVKQYSNLPPGLTKLLETHRAGGLKAKQGIQSLLQTDRRLTGLRTERGKWMNQLAQAIDQKNDKRVDNIINQLVINAPELAQMALQPETMLAYLSTSLFNEYKPEMSEVIINQPLMAVTAQNGQGGLFEALAEGTDTTNQGKKQKMTLPRRLKYRR